jgi:glycosyltransferase involved in cell wall biosynthesis
MPAYNEAPRIGKTVREARGYAGEVVVVDDGSVDRTAEEAERAGARVIRQRKAGYIASIKRGFCEARGEVVVTMDADGEHRAQDIPRLMAPILEDEADLVLGVRSHIPRLSERFLNWLTNFKVKVSDSGTGFRALRRTLALKLELKGRCICGISVLEPATMGARIAEVTVRMREVDKPRRIAWFHVPQVWYVLRRLALFSRCSRMEPCRKAVPGRGQILDRSINDEHRKLE